MVTAVPSTSPAPTALVLAAFDSQLKWAAALWAELRARGFECTVAAPRQTATLSDAQVAATGVDHVLRVPAEHLVDLALQHDVVVNALSGPFVQRFTLELADAVEALPSAAPGPAPPPASAAPGPAPPPASAAPGPAPPPVVVAGWVGVIIEKSTAGYLDRAATDVLAVNARHELRHFTEVAGRLGLDTANLLLSGLPILSTSPRPQDTGPIRTVLFADQPTVPSSPVERLHVYRRLIAHAHRHPERRVLLKPRHRRGEGTFHRMRHHPEDLLAGEDLPPNFSFSYRPVPELLEQTDLLLTMSSTACLEAVDRGRRVALVLDLGVHERHGNHVFLDSGLLRTFDQIDADDIGIPDPAWLDSWFGGRDVAPAVAVVDRVEALLTTGERPSRSVLASPYLRGARDLQRARNAGPPRPLSTWRRRRAEGGPLRGTAVHLGLEWTPPVLQRPVRRWWREHRPQR